MQRGWVHTRSRPFTLLLGLLAAAFVLSIIMFPDQAFQSSLRGLRLWWDWIFPALLPFLIATELLIGLGVVHALGVLLEPLMRRVFRLPGPGGWALAAGAVGGYPLGADATAKLRSRGDVGQADAERLLALSHLCNPMLMVGVVGAGFLHSPEAGVMLALLHYGAAAAAAFVGRLLSRAPAQALPSQTAVGPSRPESLPARAYRAMRTANAMDGRTFGRLLGDSVSNSIQTLMMVGGLMMIFSVMIKIVEIRLGGGTFSDGFLRILPGFLEPHLGAFAYSQISGWIPSAQAACIGAALAWSGFSLHAQVLGFTNGTDIRYGPFFRFRLLHGALAAVLTFLLWNPLGRLLHGSSAVFSPDEGWTRTPSGYPGEWSFREIAAMWGSLFMLLALLLAFMLLVSLVIRVLERAAARRAG